MMVGIRLTACLLVLGIVIGSERVRGAERSPNIVLLYADDLGWGDVGFNGRTEWTTPNLDALARGGMTFKRFYTAAVVCAPSRAAMLTGKATIHCGVSRNDDDLPGSEVTIAEALHARGYATGLFGKWHHGKPRGKSGGPPGQKPAYVHPMDQGFDEFFGFTDATHAWEKFPEMLWDGRERKPASGYADDLFTEHAIDFIRRHKDRPFFLYVPFVAVHFNIEAPADEIALHAGHFREEDNSHPLNATYAALVTRLDKNVGQIARAIDELGLARETLIVFASDHGATFERGNQQTSFNLDSNRPFRGQKRTVWEGGVRIPAFACWPGRIEAGTVSQEVMQSTDLLPTFVAAAGGSPDPAWHVDGINLLGSWTGKSPLPPRTIFWEWRSEGSNQLAALRGDLKVVITNGGKAELYDVVRDPAERRDLASSRAEDSRQLQDELKTWMATESRP